MTDFSKLFTDPSAEVYGPDATESAMWQQSTTNPFAILHAIAARRNANNRRDQYAQQLAAHDARAREGASALSAQEFRQNIPLEYIKRGDLDPSYGMDLAGLRMSNGEVDPRIRRQSHAFQAQQSADAMKTHAEGLKAYAETGYKLQDPGRIPDNYLNLSDLIEAPTLAEREQNARGNANSKLPFKKIIVEPRIDPDGNMVSYQENYATREEMLGQPAPNASPPPPAQGAGKTNAGGTKTQATTVPPERTKKAAPGYAPQEKITPGPATTKTLDARPPEQKAALTKLRDRGIPTAQGTYQLVRNSVQIDADGNIILKMRAVIDGKVSEMDVAVLSDGRMQDITQSQ